MNKHEAWLSLILAPDLGAKTIHKLLIQYAEPETILSLSYSELQNFGLKKNTIEAIKQPNDEQLKASLTWLEEPNHHLITLNEENYPEQLKTISDPPPVLFVRGDPEFLLQPQLAIVGSRNPTAGGYRTAKEFAQHLSQAGITITSGLATGIDAASHQGARVGRASASKIAVKTAVPS